MSYVSCMSNCIHSFVNKYKFLSEDQLCDRYITSEDVVEVKGKVACEISSADELTLTELMFSGTLKDATVEQMVALLSCFVWQEKLQDAPKPREELDLLFFQLQETARRVANLQLECKVIDITKPSYGLFVDIIVIKLGGLASELYLNAETKCSRLADDRSKLTWRVL